LKAGNEWEIVEDPPWATIMGEARFFANRASQAACVLFGVCDAGVDTAIVLNVFDTGENLDSSDGDLLRVYRHLVAEGSSHSMIRFSSHRARYFEVKRSDVVAILICNDLVAWE